MAHITKTIQLPIVMITSAISETIERELSRLLDGTCIVEGFVKPHTISNVQYSCGLVKADTILFETMFTCYVCYPTAGLQLECLATEVTKAGIRSISATESPSPFEVFVLRDYMYDSDAFNAVRVGDVFTGIVVSSRFEITDSKMSIVARIGDTTVA
jgi:hypothetical protein